MELIIDTSRYLKDGQFIWHTAKTGSYPVSALQVAHLKGIVQMIWNHFVSPEFGIAPVKLFFFDQITYSREYLSLGFYYCLLELNKRILDDDTAELVTYIFIMLKNCDLNFVGFKSNMESWSSG